MRAGIIYSLLGLAIPTAGVRLLASVGEWIFGLEVYAEHEQTPDQAALARERVHAALWVGITLIATTGSAAPAISG